MSPILNLENVNTALGSNDKSANTEANKPSSRSHNHSQYSYNRVDWINPNPYAKIINWKRLGKGAIKTGVAPASA